jgi:hypothetical protein
VRDDQCQRTATLQHAVDGLGPSCPSVQRKDGPKATSRYGPSATAGRSSQALDPPDVHEVDGRVIRHRTSVPRSTTTARPSAVTLVAGQQAGQRWSTLRTAIQLCSTGCWGCDQRRQPGTATITLLSAPPLCRCAASHQTRFPARLAANVCVPSGSLILAWCPHTTASTDQRSVLLPW